jgi:hypothetical protein
VHPSAKSFSSINGPSGRKRAHATLKAWHHRLNILVTG